jgi:tetratricopeptide (TPR) repeat protein
MRLTAQRVAILGWAFAALAPRIGVAQPPAASEAPDTTPARPACAVIPFKNVTGVPTSAYLASVIEQALHPALAAAGTWTLLERARLRALLAEADLKAAGVATGRPIKLKGADRLIVGEYRDDSGIVSVLARLVDAKTGKVLREATWTGHVSGLPDAMAEHIARVLSDKPPADPALPANLQTLFDRACRDLAHGRIDAAIDACTKVLETRRGHVPTLLVRGYAQLEKKGWTRYAVKDFERVLEADPDNISAKLGLAHARLAGARRQADEALAILADVLRIQPDQGEAHYLTAVAQMKLDQPTEALRAAVQATELLPEFAPAWTLLAELQLESGNAAQAVASATRATTFAPGDPSIWVVCGDARWALGEKPAAKAAYEKALSLKPPPMLKRSLDARLKRYD